MRDGPFRGHLWADPLVGELQRLLKRVLQGSQECQEMESHATDSETPETAAERWPVCAELRRKKQKARQDVLDYWNHEHLTQQMLARLTVIHKQALTGGRQEL